MILTAEDRHRLRRGLPVVLSSASAGSRNALALVPECTGLSALAAVLSLNSWVPREGISRDEYLHQEIRLVEAYKGIGRTRRTAASEEGADLPALNGEAPSHTIAATGLIHWGGNPQGSPPHEQRLNLNCIFFAIGGRPHQTATVLVQGAAAECRARIA